MAQLTVKINGYAYNVGCEDGQEAHLQQMATQIQARIDSIKALGGSPSGEGRLLVLAALLMADELHDAAIELNTLRTAKAEAERLAAERAGRAGDPPANPIEKPTAQTQRRIARLARKAEDIAASVEQP